jgi:hypothetical protein
MAESVLLWKMDSLADCAMTRVSRLAHFHSEPWKLLPLIHADKKAWLEQLESIPFLAAFLVIFLFAHTPVFALHTLSQPVPWACSCAESAGD